MTEYNIRLNPNCASVVHTGLKFKTGDKGITFKIAVEELDITGTTARIVFLRANGTSVESNISGTDGVYTYKTLGNEFAVPGKTVADVKFYTDNDRISTASFIFEVGADTMDGLGAGTSGYSDTLEQMMSEIEATREKMEQVVENAEQTQLDMEAALQKFVEEYAGTGALNPRGAWSPDETYSLRDIVHHGNCLWIGLEESIDVEPTEDNSTAWMFALSGGGESSEEIQKIIDGIIPAGDSNKLGGKDAREYALVDDLSEHNYPAITLSTVEEVDVFFNTVSANMNAGTSYRRRVYVEVGGHNRFPSGIYELFGYFHNEYYQYQIVIGYFGKKFYRDKAGSAWEEWKVDATTTDLENYLPVTGGTVEKNAVVPFEVKNTGADVVAIGFNGNSGSLGGIGFNGVDNPTYFGTNGNFSFHHDGNSAKVVKATSAPSDTTAVWVDTTNKVTKIYKDGAWTALT